ncbi:NTP transferase domain-containing protein [bacterium]|nr:NTP transferase domain-containing protein [bacterium]
MKAVIMAGGEGTRLRPMTVTSPKPMLPLCNRPVLEYVFDLLVRHGIDTVILTMHYLADDIISYFNDGFGYQLKIIYSTEDEPLGTAGSIKKIEQYLDDTFLVISGDALTDLDISRLLAYHREKNAVATLTLTRVEKPVEYGVVITEESGRIQRFLEKPSWGEVFSDQVNTGIYVLEPEILKLMEPGKAYDFSKDIFPQLLEHERGLYGYVTNTYWCDMGDLDNFRKCVQDLFNGKVLHELVGTERKRGIWVGEGTKISPSATLEGPLLIGRNCHIGSDAYIGPYTCLGDNCSIGDGAFLLRGILFNNVFFGRRSHGTNCIVGRRCTIKSNVILSDGCVVGDDCHLGRGVRLAAKVKIWPNKRIADGNTVSMDIVWGKLASGALFGQNGVLGLGNIEITPEFAMRLGAAYGTLMPKGATVSTSRDAHAVSRLINRAIICGFNSVGVNIMDCRLNPAPVSRQMVSDNPNLCGGIHTRIYQDNPRYIEIEFFDHRGVNIDASIERKIDNIFSRQDFRRTEADEVGHIEYADDPVGQYCERFLRYVSVDRLREAHLKVVIDYAYGSASAVLPNLLSRLGVEAVNLNAYLDVDKSNEVHTHREQAIEQLCDIVEPLRANFGILIDTDGESFVVVDDKGHLIDGGQLLAMMAYMMFNAFPDSVVAVPISASRVLDKIADKCHGRIVRTKTDMRSLMHTSALGQSRLALAGTPNGSFIYPTFSPGVDAFFAVCKLMELIVKSNRPLSELVSLLPKQHTLHAVMDCDWSAKAKVMRLLVELYRDQLMEMLDGVRIKFEHGIGLVLPHPALARLKLWVDADSASAASEILEQLESVIKEMIDFNEDEEHINMLTYSKYVPNVVQLPEERAFHFWMPGRYLGIQARSLHTFIDVLHYVDISSIEYHANRRDFSRWIASELGQLQYAQAIAELETKLSGEELRRGMLKCFGDDLEGE